MYREHASPAAFTGWIECVWFSAATDEPRAHAVRPDGCVDIVYSAHQGLRMVGVMTAEQRFHFPPALRSPASAFTLLVRKTLDALELHDELARYNERFGGWSGFMEKCRFGAVPNLIGQQLGMRRARAA